MWTTLTVSLVIKENIFLIDRSTAWILNTVKTSLNEKV